jgi:hypothetical protein
MRLDWDSGRRSSGVPRSTSLRDIFAEENNIYKKKETSSGNSKKPLKTSNNLRSLETKSSKLIEEYLCRDILQLL